MERKDPCKTPQAEAREPGAQGPRRGPLERLLDEFAGEKALALGRIAARMEKALAALRGFDGAAGGGELTRDDLLAAAGEAVWFYIVQREVMGWYRHEEALRTYGVPAEVLVRIGPRPRR